ncbi:MAG: dephospho-CoA kinase [Chryseolinea sp.]
MRLPVQIGVTGGIGSGKSLICRIFSCLGVPIYDADSHAKELMTTDGILISNIKKEFGELSYHGDGTINRNYLSSKVFNNTEKLQQLNNLVHPRVREDYNKWMNANTGHSYVVKEAALMFEAGSYQQMDKVVVVSAPDELRIRRVLKRDSHRSEIQIKGIIENQMPEEEKVRRADFTVRNDGKVLVITQILQLHAQFLLLQPRPAAL